MPGKPPRKLRDQFAKDSVDLTTAELSERYRKRPRTIQDWRKFLEGEGYKVGRGRGIPTLEPRPRYNVPRLDKWERLEGDAMVAGDFHLPFVDWLWIKRLMQIGEQLDIRRLIIIGDFLDAKALNGFLPKDVPVAWETELREAEHSIDCLADWFTEIVYCYGNHESNRVIARLEGHLSPERFGRLVSTDPVLRVSQYHYVELYTANGKWRLTHQKPYRKIPLSAAKTIWERRLCHVVTHHQHRTAMGFDPSGRFMLIDNGWMADERYMDWMMLEDRGNAAPINGFLAIKGGFPLLYGPMTDWGKIE